MALYRALIRSDRTMPRNKIILNSHSESDRTESKLSFSKFYGVSLYAVPFRKGANMNLTKVNNGIRSPVSLQYYHYTTLAYR